MRFEDTNIGTNERLQKITEPYLPALIRDDSGLAVWFLVLNVTAEILPELARFHGTNLSNDADNEQAAPGFLLALQLSRHALYIFV